MEYFEVVKDTKKYPFGSREMNTGTSVKHTLLPARTARSMNPAHRRAAGWIFLTSEPEMVRPFHISCPPSHARDFEGTRMELPLTRGPKQIMMAQKRMEDDV
jgi:hypothetical protein